MKKLFILNAYPSSGKDEFKKYVSTYIPTYSTSIINEVKTFANDLYGESVKDDERRKLLSEIENFLAEVYNIPYQLTSAKVDWFLKSNKEVMIIDVRKPHVIKELVDALGFETILIRRNKHHKADNDADMFVEDYEYDYIIENNGTLEELEEKAKEFVKNLYTNLE